MNIYDSAQLKNRIGIGSVLLALVIYGYLSFALSWMILIPTGLIALVTTAICKKEATAAHSNDNSFKKNYPLNHFGSQFGEFEHVFQFERALNVDLQEAIRLELADKTPVETLEPITITDIDGELKKPDKRDFFKADGTGTMRGSKVNLVLYFSEFGRMQSIQWWVLAGGFVSRDKFFNFVAYSPLTIWFWLVPYMKKNFDVLSRIRGRYIAFNDTLDIKTRIRCMHDAVFTAVVGELNKNGVDTSDLVAQREQMLNINVSGGNVKMGNIVQGAMNRLNSRDS